MKPASKTPVPKTETDAHVIPLVKSSEPEIKPEVIKEKTVEVITPQQQKEVIPAESVKIKPKTPADIKTYEDLQEVFPFSKKEPTLTELKDGVNNKTILMSIYSHPGLTNAKEQAAKVELQTQNTEKDLQEIEKFIPDLKKEIMKIESNAENMSEIEKANLDIYNGLIAKMKKLRSEIESRKNELKNMKEEIEVMESGLISYFKPHEFNGRKYHEVFDGKGKRVAIIDRETNKEYNFNNPEKTLIFT